MKRLVNGMAVLFVLAIADAGVARANMPAATCAAAKQEAAAKKIAAKLKCWRKAIGNGAASADPACLAAAEAKFDAAIAKAEAKGGCAVTGDGSAIEDAADSCVDSIVTLTPVTTTSTTLVAFSCPTLGAPCGSCAGGGVCMPACSPACAHVCVEAGSTTTGCADDSSCAAGELCTTNALDGSCGIQVCGTNVASCHRGCP